VGLRGSNATMQGGDQSEKGTHANETKYKEVLRLARIEQLLVIKMRQYRQRKELPNKSLAPSASLYNRTKSIVSMSPPHRSPMLISSNPNRSLLTPSLGINRALPTHLTRLLDLLLHLRSADTIARIDQSFHQERPADYIHSKHPSVTLSMAGHITEEWGGGFETYKMLPSTAQIVSPSFPYVEGSATWRGGRGV
jgi:hypothetical protein